MVPCHIANLLTIIVEDGYPPVDLILLKRYCVTIPLKEFLPQMPFEGRISPLKTLLKKCHEGKHMLY